MIGFSVISFVVKDVTISSVAVATIIGIILNAALPNKGVGNE
jgi:xanthine/uracil permease